MEPKKTKLITILKILETTGYKNLTLALENDDAHPFHRVGVVIEHSRIRYRGPVTKAIGGRPPGPVGGVPGAAIGGIVGTATGPRIGG